MIIKPRYVDGRRPGDDQVFYEVTSGIYERFYKPQPGNIVVDIGAHAGFFSGRASELVGKNGQVIAFEPEPDNFRVLKENTRNIPNIEVHQLAIWNENTSLWLHLSHSCAEHSVKYETTLSQKIMVPAVTLTTFMSGIKVDFIKIDVEGAELEVLQGSARILEKWRPRIVMELAESQRKDVVAYLERFNYTTIIHNETNTAHAAPKDF